MQALLIKSKTIYLTIDVPEQLVKLTLFKNSLNTTSCV